MPRDDYAILVGISRYAAPHFPPLQGPPRDVQRFYHWLTDPRGGDVDPANITTIVTPDPPRKVSSVKTPPLFSDFHDAFERLVTDDNHSPVYHRDSRLYLYFSGHGFCQIHDRIPQAALYAANANRVSHWNIAGTLYALWARDAAIFGEIVLVMDCCRDAEAAKIFTPPVLSTIINPGAARQVKLFSIYAAPKGGKAQERPIPELGNQVHSLLTHVLLDAFHHAPADPDGKVTGSTIKDYVENAWPAACGGFPADLPEIYIPPTGDITFFTRPPHRLPQTIRFAAWHAGAQVEIHDGGNRLYASLVLPAAGSTSALLTRADQTIETVPIANRSLTVALPAGLYRLRLVADDRERQVLFQAGGPDVTL